MLASPVATARTAGPSEPAPVARFRTLVPGAPAPERADRDALGTVPVRAARYCDALAVASGWGWWLRPPADFDLRFDGSRLWHAPAGTPAHAPGSWAPLDGYAHLAGFAARFDAAAPPECRGYSPPFLAALPEPGVVQVWTGVVASTAPGWSLLVRPPANLPLPPGLAAFEGMVETDGLWSGPLFANFRLTRTDEPVPFRRATPFVQVVPVPQAAYADALLDAFEVAPGGLAGMDAADWAGWARDVVAPSDDPDPRPGRYATAARRRRKSGRAASGAGGCPFHAASARAGG